jgi:membrane associated rhomboid family serine protease
MLDVLLFALNIIIYIFVSSFFQPTPIGDTGTVRFKTVPYMTLLLIVANSLVFMIFQAPNYYQGSQLLFLDDNSNQGIRMINDYINQVWTYGYRSLLMREELGIGAFVGFTSMFMHGDMWHLLYNMIYLWTFGRRVEDACGPWRYLVFYLAAGMIAGLGSEFFNMNGQDIPSIGASGAIAGVMGAYLVLFPASLITCFWGIGILLRLPIVVILKIARVKWVKGIPNWRWTIRLPGFLLLIFFLGSELIATVTNRILNQEDLAGVNNAAHLMGFLAAVLIFFFVRKNVMTLYFSGRRL